MRNHEFIDHTADIIVRASGDRLEEAFAELVTAMFALITDRSEIRRAVTVEVAQSADDPEALLVGFLSRLVLIHETEGLVFADAEVTISAAGELKARCVGEHFDPPRHRHGLHIKAVSYHLIEVTPPRGGRPATVQVLFDI